MQRQVRFGSEAHQKLPGNVELVKVGQKPETKPAAEWKTVRNKGLMVVVVRHNYPVDGQVTVEGPERLVAANS